MIDRRSLLRAALAMPVIVAASSLMPLRGVPLILRPRAWIRDTTGRITWTDYVPGEDVCFEPVYSGLPREIVEFGIETFPPIDSRCHNIPIAERPITLLHGDSLIMLVKLSLC